MDPIYDDLNEIFRDVFGDDAISLTPSTTAADVAGWDSFNHINVVVAVESRFGIKFSTAEVERLRNVGDMATLIARKRAAA